MNNKGFTLVELLGVIVILAIIVGLGTIGVVGILSNTKEKTNDLNDRALLDAAVSYGTIRRIDYSISSNYESGKCNNILSSKDLDYYVGLTVTIENCLEDCPSDFIIEDKKSKYSVNAKYIDSDVYKKCSYEVNAGDVIDGDGISKKTNGTDVILENGQLFDDSKLNCNHNARILIYKDNYSTLNAINLEQKHICVSK